MRTNTLALFAFVKDEADIIKSFLDHHVAIFDEITIIDNGSTDGTKEIISQYDVDLIVDECPFSMKGEACTRIMKESSCDLLVPMDADEKIVFDNKKRLINKPAVVRYYLRTLDLDGSKYKINKIYNMHPDNDGWYDESITHAKMIFPRSTFMYTDPGFHRGRTTLDGDSNFDDPHYWRAIFRGDHLNDKISPLNISYLHEHFRSKEAWLKNTEKKLRARIGEKWNDVEFLKKYTGPSIHCKREYLRFIEDGVWHSLKKNKFVGRPT